MNLSDLDYLHGKPLETVAIDRIGNFATKNRPVVVAYSGGKDSEVVLELAKRSGVTFTTIHNICPMDPAETRAWIHQKPYVQFSRPTMSLAEAAAYYKTMPYRDRRWCCRVFKEHAPSGSLVVTGIRWDESPNRNKRRMIEHCRRDMSIHYLNPIIDWSTDEVWTYIFTRKLKTHPLYAQGFRRIGCVNCPLTDYSEAYAKRWPNVTAVWRKLAEYVHTAQTNNPRWEFESPEHLFQAWKSRLYYAPNTETEDLPLLESCGALK